MIGNLGVVAEKPALVVHRRDCNCPNEVGVVRDGIRRSTETPQGALLPALLRDAHGSREHGANATKRGDEYAMPGGQQPDRS
jgi:hypothetical protein